MKNTTKKITIILFSSILFVPLVVFLIVCLCLFIGSNITYQKHRPSLVYQTSDLFCDNTGNVYFSTPRSSNKIYKYDSINHEVYERAFSKGYEAPYCIKAVADSNYIYLCYKNNDNNYYINFLNKDLHVINQFFFESAEMPMDIEANKSALYCLIENKEEKKFYLKKIKPQESSYSVLSENVDKIETFRDEDTTIYVNRNAAKSLSILKEKTSMIHYYTNKELHQSFDEISIILKENSFVINNGSNAYIFPKNSAFETFYWNSFLIDNRVIFATYDYLENDECGTMNDSFLCTCRLGQSYLYCFDIISLEFTLIHKFDRGSFLIDYDLNNFEYYKNGRLYINDESTRDCTVIEPGALEKIKGQNYFSPGDEKAIFCISFINNAFYGI